jgi:hypothetical protein
MVCAPRRRDQAAFAFSIIASRERAHGRRRHTVRDERLSGNGTLVPLLSARTFVNGLRGRLDPLPGAARSIVSYDWQYPANRSADEDVGRQLGDRTAPPSPGRGRRRCGVSPAPERQGPRISNPSCGPNLRCRRGFAQPPCPDRALRDGSPADLLGRRRALRGIGLDRPGLGRRWPPQGHSPAWPAGAYRPCRFRPLNRGVPVKVGRL